MAEVEQRDVIDEVVWQHLGRVIAAAHGLNRDNFARLSRDFASQVRLPGQQKAGLYLWYLLRHALAHLVGGAVPREDDLGRAADNYGARFSAVVDADRNLLEDTFRKVFELPPRTKEIGPGELLVLGTAALGVLYVDPSADLEKMKPKLAQWWSNNSEQFHSQGLRR
jgi:hypothetical protein